MDEYVHVKVKGVSELVKAKWAWASRKRDIPRSHGMYPISPSLWEMLPLHNLTCGEMRGRKEGELGFYLAI